ncbi:unnamed protein product [Acanthoscelides obtectus]|uniref:Uncharacterized protein n=1 Tax=Acanthoscelides obtectus TaxID=200917 RepID=A0A9P0KRN6_ACAOB|nr:unnamed protein product [Acanthoscelides obtectus]CAK1620973.1 hypothetical protein AOBTE_LOCUS682 [Acanthoscelides obtectus]
MNQVMVVWLIGILYHQMMTKVQIQVKKAIHLYLLKLHPRKLHKLVGGEEGTRTVNG